MKVVETGKGQPPFTPIELKITMESLEDLKTLWHRLNVPPQVVEENTNDMFEDSVLINDSSDVLFRVLNNIAKHEGWIK